SCTRTRAVRLSSPYLLSCSPLPPVLHPFPTRRSSDLRRLRAHPAARLGAVLERRHHVGELVAVDGEAQQLLDAFLVELERAALRSEEHTSELQSLTNLVCRLLLEKKKRIERYTQTYVH